MSPPRIDHESLRDLLARLHERLSKAQSVDSGSRELLGKVMGDIERALGQGGIEGAAGSAAQHAPRLESLAVQFQIEHPGLAASLRQLIDTLGKAGI